MRLTLWHEAQTCRRKNEARELSIKKTLKKEIETIKREMYIKRKKKERIRGVETSSRRGRIG